MRLTRLAIKVALTGVAFSVITANAAWVPLPKAPLATPGYGPPCGSVAAPELRCTGTANNDRTYIASGAANGTTTMVKGKADALTSITVTTYNFPTSLVLLDTLVTSFSGNNGLSGTFTDYVFKDNTTNTLVFGSRVQTTLLAEVNDIFRSGFNGYNVDTAWTRVTSGDLRLYSSARSHTGIKQGVDVYDADRIDFRSDINQSEGNPWSGLYLIRTDASVGSYTWALSTDAVELRQGGEESQVPTSVYLSGFVPTLIAAVPEPSEYLMLLAGLGMVLMINRRKQLNG